MIGANNIILVNRSIPLNMTLRSFLSSLAFSFGGGGGGGETGISVESRGSQDPYMHFLDVINKSVLLGTGGETGSCSRIFTHILRPDSRLGSKCSRLWSLGQDRCLWKSWFNCLSARNAVTDSSDPLETFAISPSTRVI